MIDELNLKVLRKIPRIGYYFRYELHRQDFNELIYIDRLRGHYAAKPLYGKLTQEGYVDTSGSFNGDVATLFVPLTSCCVHSLICGPNSDSILVTGPTNGK